MPLYKSKKTVIIFCMVASIIILGFTNISFFIKPSNFPEPVYNFAKDPLQQSKINLGRQLFYDPLLSRDTTISCASCHLSFSGFAHTDHPLSHGIQNRIGIRNALPIFNLAWSKFFMWDGSITNSNTQAFTPITHKDEMDDNLTNVVQKIRNEKKYTFLFKQAFGDTSITSYKIAKALSQFTLSLVSANSKYDKVMRKQNGFTFNSMEQKGYTIFKAACNHCHTEPLFTNHNFENNGLEPNRSVKDWGRMKITKLPSDSLKFKVPSLRNVEVTYPYMHDGRLPNLQMVLYHYTETIYKSQTLSPLLQTKLYLSEEDKNCLIAFLKTLTDEEFLNNPKFQSPN